MFACGATLDGVDVTMMAEWSEKEKKL